MYIVIDDPTRTFVTSDHHFGHAEAINYPECERPFKDAMEMDERLVQEWNRAVGIRDTVFHLGDFCLEERAIAARYFKRLNGSIFVLKYEWHHDKYWIEDTGPLISRNWHRVKFLPPLVVVEMQDAVITLCHYPLAEWEQDVYGGWHLHGHSHGTYKAKGRILDVGVDCHEFRPISLAEVADIMKEK